jgi:hypothetical protein
MVIGAKNYQPFTDGLTNSVPGAKNDFIPQNMADADIEMESKGE